MTGVTAATHARLVMTLPGTWLHADPRDKGESHRRIGRFVTHALGRADELSPLRAALREALGTLVDRAATDGAAGIAEAVFVCDEISRGTKLPLCLAVFAPEHMRISPAVGTEPSAVIDAFHRALTEVGRGDGWERVACRDGQALRRVQVTDAPLDPHTPEATTRLWSADYWRTVPGSKNLMLVTATSPLADIPATLVRLTDAVLASSRYVVGERP